MPTTLPSDFVELLAAFAAAQVEYLLVGGYAVAFHAEPRATKDIDLWIGGSVANIERLVRAVASFGAPSHILDALRTQTAEEFVFMGVPPLRVDFLRSIQGVDFESAYARRIKAEWDGVEISVLGLEDLIASKRAAGRPQDLVDAASLAKLGRPR
jgi:predicted nucleotidyltransferase